VYLPACYTIHMDTSAQELEELYTLHKGLQDADKMLIEKAYHFAKVAHAPQVRKSGEPYFNHVYQTGIVLARLQMDAVTISAGIMHDVLEDTEVTEAEMLAEFGSEIVFLVEGVTKLGRLKYQGIERHAESLRKFFIAMTDDIRVVIIKLADRLHNVSTLEHLPAIKSKRIALETLEIHARLADRLGMGRLKAELEDKAFPFAFPEEYKEVKELVEQTLDTSEEHLQDVARTLTEELEVLGVTVIRMDRRVKHLYSLWQKLKKHHMDIEKIYDIVALRIIVSDVPACYQTFGIIHGLYKPLPGRIKDYIAIPKPNGYMSLHTTVFDGNGGTFEVQIRTDEMNRDAEFGVASHLRYKEIGKESSKKKIEEKTDWTRDLLVMQSESTHHGEFLDNLKMDFFENRVFVYTPKGDVIELPEDASPIDFAFAIHTDVGMKTASAKVNGKMAALDTKLRRGDIVQITTSNKATPNRKWIDLCKTSLARKQIKAYLKLHGGPIDRLFIK
jgi:GTP diphosphokinase / guanosine-3',5'-bis(diphosphate) 3'-diphosphatase